MLLNKKYNNLLPTKDFLTDEVILLSAWKKSHQHIRGINSYVDCLDLDKSAIELDSRIKKIARKLKARKINLCNLELIPSPKSYAWDFSENIPDAPTSLENLSYYWSPKKSDGSSDNNVQPMRPLAHVTIDDQTIFTALMILLANKVESLQGDPSTPFKDVHEKMIINYGNRLHCKYLKSEAKYSWGNSDTYSKFFKDYQQFLARPIHFGREAKKIKTNDEEIYEIHLDFSKFYDSIDRVLLNKKISELIENITGREPDLCIKRVLKSFVDWEWTKNSHELYKDVCKNEHIESLAKNKGIPQGLVAGGFLANIYMLNLDKSISNLIGEYLDKDNEVFLVDACRYVDDLRLIIKANKKYPEEQLGCIVNKKLDISELELILQNKKTKIQIFSSRDGAISAKLADLQNKLSGPMPLHELDEQLGHLEGLIELSDNLSINDDNAIKNKNDFTAELAFIDKTFNDVRKDTLLRFTANKVHTLLRQKRNMITQEVNDAGEPIPGSWDYLQERMARKLISRWTRDPSLSSLLKKGLELFPHVNLLKPILSNLDEVRCRGDKRLKIFSEYCLSEILRHSATVIHTKDRWVFPAHSEPEKYFDFLDNYASGKLLKLKELSVALKEQVIFFCLIRNQSILKKPVGEEPFDLISQLQNGFRQVNITLTVEDFKTAVLLANQVSVDKSKVHRSAINALETISKRSVTAKSLNVENLEEICRGIMLSDPNLFKLLYLKAYEQDLGWTKKVKRLADYLCLHTHSKINDDLTLYNGKELSLLSIIRVNNSPFKQENGVLKLLQSLLDNLKNAEFHNPIDISNTTVKCNNWGDVLRLDSSSKLEILNLEYYDDEDLLFHATPKWLTDNHRPLYHIGMFTRNCLLGEIDWTGIPHSSNDHPSYRGIKSNMLKRQIGMMHSPETFGEMKSPMTDWLSSLLFKLLQWPGIEGNEGLYTWPKDWSLDELLKCINNRIEHQKKLFCELSNMPTYTEKVKLEWQADKNHLNVVMVQPLLPMVKDFDSNGLKLDNRKYRAKHRRHVTSVAELILHNIASVDSINEKPKLKGKVDLIIWPELSVSPEDLDVLERLSDKTGAIIFSGIIFSHINNPKELNNSAIWIIPNKNSSGRRFIKRLQGKYNMTAGEKGNISPWRPYQLIIELLHPAFSESEGFKITGSICYDATDIKLSADLKDKSHAYIISAMNKDIATFDSMVDALFYHMYQYVVLVNSGEFGGSVAKAPYKERYHKLITHTHGSHQVTISSFEMNMFDFRESGKSLRSNKETKTPPAGDLK
ncbi:reverse transcriptase domain-containing protein [Serratia ficaria]|uniref:reverse transcriptase domain-containing protein n=1 Tax=Serratia ficaria TaxID=61651 RepID=UPI00217A9AE9|nr:reverse transcriptase domain-containing protein [Serratia ficaria]CAI1841949.1 Reverse transcriptase (RNA-dependent DNA polymerase) [Serratia ficaria]